MKDYYYIKFKPVKYEDDTQYLCDGASPVRKDPAGLKIFDDIEKAIKYKHDMLSDKEFQGTYIFDYYEISIERL